MSSKNTPIMTTHQSSNEKSSRTIMLWLVWAATAVGIYLSLYQDTHVWEYIKDDRSKITWVILCLFFIGVVISFLLASVVNNESSHALHYGHIARKKGLPGIQVKGSKRAVERFFLSLKQIITNNIQPDIDGLLEVEFSTYHRTSHSVEVIGNLLITLGLIGTVIGLTFTLSGLTTSLDALGHDQTQLLLGLRTAMGGMGTAFYTTLLGSVLGGVLLRVFSMITDHGIDDLSDQLKKICMVYCATDCQPTIQKDMHIINAEIDTLATNVTHLTQSMHDARSAMAQFREQTENLGHSHDDKAAPSLNDAVALQNYYKDLLRDEIRLINKINGSWWKSILRSLKRRSQD